MSPSPPPIVVVGGGIAGLAAAWELGGDGPGAGHPVVVVEREAVLGGKLATVEFEGRRVDVGPDGFLGRRPEALELCREVGLGEDLVPIGESGASVWSRGRLRPLPGGLVLGTPTRLGALARSRVLGTAGNLRAALDLLAPRPDRRGPVVDRAVGPLVARKLGRRVVDVLVDPLVGGIHAGSTTDMSAAAVFPALLEASRRRGSLMRSLRKVVSAAATDDAEEAPLFWTLPRGMASLVERTAGRLTERGTTLRTSVGATALRQVREGTVGWVVETTSGEVEAAGVVLAVPAHRAADLLGPHEEEASRLLRSVEHASVAVVTLSYPDGALPPLDGTGFLVPRARRVARPPADLEGFMVTAVTYLDRKWPNLAGPGTLLRASLGRHGDERPADLDDGALAERAAAELRHLLGTDASPRQALVTRWPQSFPQYRVHHPLRVSAVETALQRLPPVAVAGASYHGVGIPACIASGRRAGRTVAERLPAVELGR